MLIFSNYTDVDVNFRELFCRVAFNIYIGNGEVHFRNHEFLLTVKNWVLSLAYDMNTAQNGLQSLLIDNKADLSAHSGGCKSIINKVVDVINYWRTRHCQAKNELIRENIRQ